MKTCGPSLTPFCAYFRPNITRIRAVSLPLPSHCTLVYSTYVYICVLFCTFCAFLHGTVPGMPHPGPTPTSCPRYVRYRFIPYVHYSKSQIHPVRAFSLWYMYLEGLSRVVCGTLIPILVYFTSGCTILIQYSGHSIPHPPVHMN